MLVVRKGEDFHSYQMPLGLGPLTYFPVFEEYKLSTIRSSFRSSKQGRHVHNKKKDKIEKKLNKICIFDKLVSNFET
jgi:hypothetical protein